MPVGPIRKGAGELRKRIELQSSTVTTDALGGRTETWATYATVWGAVEPQPGIVGKDKAEVITIMVIRYRSGVLAEQRAVSEGVTYTILAVIDPALRHRELNLHCVEIEV